MSRDPLQLGLKGYDLRWSTDTDGWVLPEPVVSPWGLAALLARETLDAHTINLLYHRRAWLTQNGFLVEGERPHAEAVTGAEGIRQLALSEGISVDSALLFALPRPSYEATAGERTTMQIRSELAPHIERAKRFAKISTPEPIMIELMTRIQDMVSDAMTYAVAQDAWTVARTPNDDRSTSWFTKYERPSYCILQSSPERPGRVELWARRAHATRQALQTAADAVYNVSERREQLGTVLHALGLRGNQT